MSTTLTPKELAEVDGIKTYAQHRAFCDSVKAARGGVYPCDWGEKMLASGKNDEVAQRYGAGYRVQTYQNTEDFLRDFLGDAKAAHEPSAEELFEELNGAYR